MNRYIGRLSMTTNVSPHSIVSRFLEHRAVAHIPLINKLSEGKRYLCMARTRGVFLSRGLLAVLDVERYDELIFHAVVTAACLFSSILTWPRRHSRRIQERNRARVRRDEPRWDETSRTGTRTAPGARWVSIMLNRKWSPAIECLSAAAPGGAQRRRGIRLLRCNVTWKLNSPVFSRTARAARHLRRSRRTRSSSSRREHRRDTWAFCRAWGRICDDDFRALFCSTTPLRSAVRMLMDPPRVRCGIPHCSAMCFWRANDAAWSSFNKSLRIVSKDGERWPRCDEKMWKFTRSWRQSR